MTNLQITIDLNAHEGTQDCNLCEWMSGEYYLTPCFGTGNDSGNPSTDNCGDPEHKWNTPLGVNGKGSCRWSYASGYAPTIDYSQSSNLICFTRGSTLYDFKQITASGIYYIDARSYCAYARNGIIYDQEVEGSKLVGRALEVRLKFRGGVNYWRYGGCQTYRDPSQTREEAKAALCQQLYQDQISAPNSYGQMIPGQTYLTSYEDCCVYDDVYFDPYPLGNCEAFGIYDLYDVPGDYMDLEFVWRTINSLNHECTGQLETLRFVPEESYSFYYYEDGGSCQRHDLCDSTGVITWET